MPLPYDTNRLLERTRAMLAQTAAEGSKPFAGSSYDTGSLQSIQTNKAPQPTIKAPQSTQTTPPTPTAPVDTAGKYGLTGENAQMVNLLQQYLDKLTQSGQKLNPNVDITPDRVAEFMAHAQSNLDTFLPYANKEIKPYFENKLKVARNDFLTTLGYSRDQLIATEQKLGEQYKLGQEQIGESAAESGFALSGRRMQQEQQLANTTQRTIEQGRQKMGFDASNLAGTFAQQYGTSNVPQFNIGTAPKVGDMSFAPQGGEQPFYQLSPETYAGLKGEQEFAQEAATRKRASELEEAFRGTAATTQQRSLTF